MVAVAVASVALKPRDDDHRAIHPDDANDVAKDVLAPPLLERLVQALGEAIVRNAREVLVVHAVVAIGNEEFLGADEAERVEKLGANCVVAGLAARQGQQRHPGALATAQEREHPSLLVVWVSGRVHRARRRLQLPELLPGAGGALILGRSLRAPADASEANERGRQDRDQRGTLEIHARGPI